MSPPTSPQAKEPSQKRDQKYSKSQRVKRSRGKLSLEHVKILLLRTSQELSVSTQDLVRQHSCMERERMPHESATLTEELFTLNGL